jgi:NAD(P)-dependent dehydrogenase (short-subunit alcohol dehydrogenase family)
VPRDRLRHRPHDPGGRSRRRAGHGRGHRRRGHGGRRARDRRTHGPHRRRAGRCLFARVADEQDDALDLLVANAWGGYESYGDADFTGPFWTQPLWRWDAMFTAGLRAQFTAVRAAAPAMIARGRGVIVVTGGSDMPGHYLGNVPYDVVKAATSRLVAALAHELRPHGVAAVGVYPGFTRTEAVVAAFAAQGADPPPETHSPEFVGRAVAGVAADPGVMALSGTGAQAAVYARHYGVTDVDGRAVAPFALPDEYRLASS